MAIKSADMGRRTELTKRVAGSRVVRAVYAFLKEVESQVQPGDDVVHPIHAAR